MTETTYTNPEWQVINPPARKPAPKINAVSTNLVWELSPAYKALGRFARINPMGDDSADDLVRSAFWSYYLNDPKQADPMPAGARMHQQLLSWVMEQPSWQASKAGLAGNMLASCYAAGMLATQLLDDPAIKDAQDAQDEANKARNEADQAAEDAQAAQDQADQSGDPDDQAAADEAKDQAGQLVAEAMAAQDAADQAMGKAMSRGMAEAVLSNAISEATDEAKKVQMFAKGWGLDNGTSAVSDMQAVQDVLGRLADDTLLELAKLIGKVKGLAASSIKGKSEQEITITTAGYTKDVYSLFTNELAMLSNKVPGEIRMAAFSDFMEHGALGVIRSAEAKSEGGMIILVDGSGSMRGERDQVAKALGIGLAQAARINGQRFWLSTFGNGHQFTAPKTDADTVAELLDWAGFLFNGGTDFNHCLGEAINILDIDTDPESVDILLITDAEDTDITQAVSDRLADLKDRFGTRLFVVQIAPNRPGTRIKAAAHKWLDFTNLDEITTILANAIWS